MTEPQAAESPYRSCRGEGPYAAAIGSALITMVEPHEGHEHAYNRWYEDDHFYSGAMAMPWMFAGRRWVAPLDLQALRYPDDSVIAQPLAAGKYISLYWITDGRYEDHLRWTCRDQPAAAARRPRVSRPHPRLHVVPGVLGRGVPRRRAVPATCTSLDYPYQGLVRRGGRRSGGRRPRRARPVAARRVPPRPPRGLADRDDAACSQPIPLPADRMAYVEDVPGLDRRLTLLSFTEVPPDECWDVVRRRRRRGRGRGLGRVELAAPFYPTLPGTDTYVDQLR